MSIPIFSAGAGQEGGTGGRRKKRSNSRRTSTEELELGRSRENAQPDAGSATGNGKQGGKHLVSQNKRCEQGKRGSIAKCGKGDLQKSLLGD